jgi:hypothetical protein
VATVTVKATAAATPTPIRVPRFQEMGWTPMLASLRFSQCARPGLFSPLWTITTVDLVGKANTR